MNDDRTKYQKALDAPSKSGTGWVGANYDSQQAAMALLLGVAHSIKAQIIFNWAQKFDVNLSDNGTELRSIDNGLLVAAVLNDWTLDKARGELL